MHNQTNIVKKINIQKIVFAILICYFKIIWYNFNKISLISFLV